MTKKKVKGPKRERASTVAGLSYKLTMPDGTIAYVVRGEVLHVTVEGERPRPAPRPIIRNVGSTFYEYDPVNEVNQIRKRPLPHTAPITFD